MRTLIYKRTHNGDPDARGCFGEHDCMGQVRDLPFEAVIGVGGRGSEAKKHGIAGKVNWIGIGPRKTPLPAPFRGPLVRFDHFLFFAGEDQPDFQALAPLLYQRLCGAKAPPRFLFENFSEPERAEINKLLALAQDEPPSSGQCNPQPADLECGKCNPDAVAEPVCAN
jgi:hypothetical protein